MKTPEEMAAFFAAMPSKKKENPFWQYAEREEKEPAIVDPYGGEICFNESIKTLRKIRDFFRLFYESFGTEAQVLCVSSADSKKLKDIGAPLLTTGQIGYCGVYVYVLPQDNHMGTTVISEGFWQKYIVGNSIVPVARVHSHHILDPYQSRTDYSTLNSGSLEIVLGHIFDDELAICYWLDVPGTDIKANTFVAKEMSDGVFIVVPHRFNRPKDEMPTEIVPDKSITCKDMAEYGYDWAGMYPLRAEKALQLYNESRVSVYFLYQDGTENTIEDVAGIMQHDMNGGIFGVDKEEWTEAYLKK